MNIDRRDDQPENIPSGSPLSREFASNATIDTFDATRPGTISSTEKGMHQDLEMQSDSFRLNDPNEDTMKACPSAHTVERGKARRIKRTS
jgi:hypothetical protein